LNRDDRNQLTAYLRNLTERELIPHLRDLCYRQNGYGSDPAFAEEFVKAHDDNWREAQDHWELIVEKVLNTDAVDRSASGRQAVAQAVRYAGIMLGTTGMKSRCPICPIAELSYSEPRLSHSDRGGRA
jgi:hypothetical protein